MTVPGGPRSPDASASRVRYWPVAMTSGWKVWLRRRKRKKGNREIEKAEMQKIRRETLERSCLVSRSAFSTSHNFHLLYSMICPECQGGLTNHFDLNRPSNFVCFFVVTLLKRIARKIFKELQELLSIPWRRPRQSEDFVCDEDLIWSHGLFLFQLSFNWSGESQCDGSRSSILCASSCRTIGSRMCRR